MLFRILKRIGYGFVIRTLTIIVIIILFVMMYCHSKSNSKVLIKMENIHQHSIDGHKNNLEIPAWQIQPRRFIKIEPRRVNNNIEDILHDRIISKKFSGGYSMKGHELYMEDRFGIIENVSNTNIGLFYIFDGHNGMKSVRLTATYLKDRILMRLNRFIRHLKWKRNLNKNFILDDCIRTDETKLKLFNITEKPKEFQEFYKIARECLNAKCSYLGNNLFKRTVQSIFRLNFQVADEDLPIQRKFIDDCYIFNDSIIDYRNFLKDEILHFDNKLSKSNNQKKIWSGTTASIVILDENQVTVANVGDSKVVICDEFNQAIQLSGDHRASNVSEQNRILEAGGFITYDSNTYKVHGQLKITRSLGDYHLKKYVIGEPSITTYDLKTNKPKFMIIGSSGLWNIFNNTNAVDFISKNLNETQFGAKNIARKAFHSDSGDNISVIVIVFDKTNLTKTSERHHHHHHKDKPLTESN